MADSTVERYLRLWGLENYIQTFKDNDINFEALQVLTTEHISLLNLSIGARAILQAQLIELKKVINNIDSQQPETSASSHEVIEDYVVELNSSNVSLSCLMNDSELGNLPSTSNIPEPLDPEQKCDLHKFLETNNDGRGLLLQYEKVGLLDKTGRRRLCNLIIARELQKDPDAKISSARFFQLAYEVTQVFKKESSAVYYTPYISFSPGLRSAAKGKLIDYYRQRRREFSKSGIIVTRPKRSLSASPNPITSSGLNVRVQEVIQNLEEPIVSSAEVQDALQWLKNSSEPWSTVESYWELTAKTRLKEFVDKDMTIIQYFNEFRPLALPSGVYLLLKDFSTLYPDHDGKLYENWPLYSNRILELARKQKVTYSSQSYNDNEDAHNIAAFMCLPFLMSTATIRKQQTKKQWRPSKLEALEGFITHIKTAAELEESITRRKNKLARLGFSLQPYIIIIGPSISEIHTRYIIVNDVKYSVTEDVRYLSTSIIHAVDSCFKILFALNAAYPVESANVWHFIQKGFYRIKTKYDKVYTTVNSLMNDLGIEL